MFANRFTAFIDACALAGALKRNLLLTLAEAEFFRLRWSEAVLEETERAIASILRADENAGDRAARARASMNAAFEDAVVVDYDRFLSLCADLPDRDDRHVLAAALKTQASVIVTDNLKHFPVKILKPLNIEARSADAFIADTIALDSGRAVAAIKRMRKRFARPELTADALLIKMDAAGMPESVDVLKPHLESL